MKKRDLIKAVEKNGAVPADGTKHEKWISKNGYPFTIPRHKEIGEGLAKKILKQSQR